jgi:hypothetical protein
MEPASMTYRSGHPLQIRGPSNVPVRIGHLGDLYDLTRIGTLAGVEVRLAVTGVPPAATAYKKR